MVWAADGIGVLNVWLLKSENPFPSPDADKYRNHDFHGAVPYGYSDYVSSDAHSFASLDGPFVLHSLPVSLAQAIQVDASKHLSNTIEHVQCHYPRGEMVTVALRLGSPDPIVDAVVLQAIRSMHHYGVAIVVCRGGVNTISHRERFDRSLIVALERADRRLERLCPDTLKLVGYLRTISLREYNETEPPSSVGGGGRHDEKLPPNNSL